MGLLGPAWFDAVIVATSSAIEIQTYNIIYYNLYQRKDYELLYKNYNQTQKNNCFIHLNFFIFNKNYFILVNT